MYLDEISQPRRTVIAGAGLGLAATALAACSSYGNKPEAAAPARRRPDRRALRRPAPRRLWPRPPTSPSGRA